MKPMKAGRTIIFAALCFIALSLAMGVLVCAESYDVTSTITADSSWSGDIVEKLTGESVRDSMNLYGTASVLSIIGTMIPALGLFVLLSRNLTQNAHMLLVADVVCIFYNVTYLMFIGSYNIDVELVFLKLNFICNMMFYLFYLYFMLEYLKWKRKWIITSYGVIAAITAVVLLNNSFSALFFSNVSLQQTEVKGNTISYLQYDNGVLFYINYGFIFIMLVGLFINSLISVIKTRSRMERINYIIMMAAQITIITGLRLWMMSDHEYDYMPFVSALSVLIILIGVFKGNFMGVVEVGRSMIFERMEDVLVTVDKHYRYLDSNKYARKIFPELETLPVGAELPAKLKAMFTTCPIPGKDLADLVDMTEGLSPNAFERWEVNGRYYRSVLTELDGNRFFDDKGIPEGFAENFEKIKKKNPNLYEKIVKRLREGRTGHSLMLIDTTDQFRLLRRVNEEKEKALAAAQSKSDFLSNMSHEIRTPMNAIVGMTQIMLRGETTDEQKEYLINIQNSGDALLSIINDILDFSKLESGKMEIIDEPYEPMSVFNDLSMIFLNRIGDHPVELIYDVDPDMPKTLIGDKLRIRQIITNIANNAIKFTEEGYIRVAVHILTPEELAEREFPILPDDQLMIHFEIEDTGQGIKEEDLDKLFGSFSQVDTKKNRAKEGTGLGLAISKSLVNSMGGEILVTSEYGKGSTFSFEILQGVEDAAPAAGIKQENRQTVAAAAFSTDIQKYNFEKLCRDFGIETVQIEDVINRSQKADVIFSDVCGADCMKQFEENDEDKPVLVVMRDPMKEKEPGQGITVNKPLYSLNFCQLINHEKTTYMEVKDEVIDFSAPDAHILIVDDNEINLKVAEGLLAPLEMHIDTASNGKEALEKIKDGAYNIIFMDHMMPEMDGVETTQHIRERDSEYMKTVPIIALTANAVAGAREEFLEAGMDDFVSKPIEMVEISRKIKAFLPRDLIQKKNVSEEAPAADDTNIEEEFAGLVNENSGINVEKGIKNSGNADMYRGFLADYIKLIDLKKKKVTDCLNDGLIRDFTIEVHALKSTSYLIGAMELGDKFYELEQLGNAEDETALYEKTPGVLAEYEGMKEVLKPFAVEESDEDKREPQDGEIAGILERLKASADEFDLDGMDECVGSLKKLKLPDALKERMNELEALVADCAADDIIELIDEVGGSI